MTIQITDGNKDFCFFVFGNFSRERVIRAVQKAYEESAISLSESQDIPSLGEIIDACEFLFHLGVTDLIKYKFSSIENAVGYELLNSSKENNSTDKLSKLIAAYLKLDDVEETKWHFYADIKLILDHHLNLSYVDTFSLKHLHSKDNQRKEVKNHPTIEVW